MVQDYGNEKTNKNSLLSKSQKTMHSLLRDLLDLIEVIDRYKAMISEQEKYANME